MTTAVVLLDHRLTIDYINAAAESLLQTSATAAVGQPLRETMLLDDSVLDALDNALENHQPYTERDAQIRLPENVTQEVDLTVNIVDGGSRQQILLELQSLNRLKRINKDDESVARQETTRRLIRGLAHEVKNPLGGIRGAAQLLEQELRELFTDQGTTSTPGQTGYEDLQEYTSVIISEADRLKTLVDRMLGPQRQLKITTFSLLKVIEHVIQVMEAENPNWIDWQRDYDPSLPDLHGDEAQIIQAVMNVVRNACEALHSTELPRIVFRTRGVRQFTIGNVRHRLVMQLEIEDNGPGVDPELEERIFFPMISGRAEGSGLGLAITQNVITQHHGSIQLHNKPGTTRFCMYLPFDQEFETLPQPDTNSNIAQTLPDAPLKTKLIKGTNGK